MNERRYSPLDALIGAADKALRVTSGATGKPAGVRQQVPSTQAELSAAHVTIAARSGVEEGLNAQSEAVDTATPDAARTIGNIMQHAGARPSSLAGPAYAAGVVAGRLARLAGDEPAALLRADAENRARHAFDHAAEAVAAQSPDTAEQLRRGADNLAGTSRYSRRMPRPVRRLFDAGDGLLQGLARLLP